MIVAAAVCPAAPWLLPGVAPHLAHRASFIARAGVAAVRGLIDADRIVVVVPSRQRFAGAAPATPTGGPPTPADPAAHSRPTVALPVAGRRPGAAPPRLTVTRSDRGRGPARSLGPAVAAQLLAAAGVDRPGSVIEAGAADRPAADPPPREVTDPRIGVGMLVLADGAATHGPSAPGPDDARAADWDRAVGTALAEGRPAALAAATASAADPTPADLMARVAGLQLLAEWTLDHPPTRSSLLVQAAPFGVGHFVARWEWDRTIPTPTIPTVTDGALRPDPTGSDRR